MRLYVLRHAEAESHAVSDAERELTPRGLEQARTVGAYCQRHGLQPELILTSPFRRAVQTADLFATIFDLTPQTVPFLASGMQTQTALTELRAYQRFGSLLIVGHQPDLGDLISALLGLPNGDNVSVGKASLTALEVGRLGSGGATLKFSLPVKMMV